MQRALPLPARRALWLVLPLLLLATRVSICQDTLAHRLLPLIEAHRGTVAVAVKHCGTGEQFRHQADRVMPTASLIKLPVLVEAYRQAEQEGLDLQRIVVLRQEDKVPGSGILTDQFSAGAQFPLRDALRLMIAFSDNTATNLVVDVIGLPATTRSMQSLGCPETRLHAKVFRRDTSLDAERSERYGLGSTTADEMVRLLELLAKRELVSPAASEAMYEHLLACDDRTKLARDLPPGTRIAHKTGAVAQSRTDAGLLQVGDATIAICVLTTDNEDRSWSDDNAAHQLCGAIGRAVYDYYQTAQPNPPAAPQLRVGAHGLQVEVLQRTLNARLAPSPQIDVDGDFGPQTLAALQQFQTQAGLPIQDHVDAAVWQALSPLVEEGPEVLPPEVVNQRRLPRRAADGTSGPPFVSCRAWCVLDRASGEVLGSFDANRPLHPASTTKIMTALVAMQMIDASPELAAQEVLFSEKADQTEGSTCGLRAGERVRLEELLYGLMLPSGNDAAVAIAEHLGALLAAEDQTPLERFVAQMNTTAQELGLQETHYHNPHGLTDPSHLASARDLARLARKAMEHSRLRQIVGTRERGCTVRSLAGYERHVHWENTNRLLDTDGYVGVKTGTTQAAGACLVACEQRGGRELIVVVLGASSAEGRYVDTRNLFRWAWSLLPTDSGNARPAEVGAARSQPVVVTERALQIHQRALLVDGHNDLPWALRMRGTPSFDRFDLAVPQPELHTDIPRLRQGGMGAQFWSVYVPVEVGMEGKALLTTLEQIDLVHRMANHYPDTFMLATSSAEIREARRSGKIACLIGMEGGHSIENSIGALRELYRRGARYMTLTHSANLDWADSATDQPNHHGLTPFGEEVVREMNRLGMLVDLSHVSPETMRHALRVCRAPVILSHSSARAVADHPRNVPDDILRMLPENGGVVMVNFYPAFVVPSAAKLSVERMEYRRQLQTQGMDAAAIEQELNRWSALHPQARGTIYDVADHIDHIVRIAGIDHVGLGADYDGVDMVPEQLEDVSCYPRLTQVLLDRGYTEEAIGKILGENLLRVLAACERPSGVE